MASNNFMVLVRCITYNHSLFIEDAMNGFCMQNTTFPFVCTIIDDASTDGEQEVILRYLHKYFEMEDFSILQKEDTDDYNLIFTRHKSNINCFFAIYFLKYNHYSKKIPKKRYFEKWITNTKYLASCEGDDYWTDSNKLQKQVLFLENHLDYIVCSHDYVIYTQDTSQFNKTTYYNRLFSNINNNSSYYNYSLDNYFDGWWTQPLTCMYRNGEYLKRIPRNRYNNWRDDIFYYYVLKQGKGALLRDNMGVYRHHSSGVWSPVNYLDQRTLSMNNAYNIFLVENDKRAFCKILRCQKLIILFHKRSENWKEMWKEIKYYFKIDPFPFFVKLIWALVRYDIGILRINIGSLCKK